MNSGENGQIIYFRLDMPAEQFKPFYQGKVKSVQVRSHDGRVIRMPASALRKFLAPDGIFGEFAVEIDTRGKLVSLNRLAER